MDELKVAIAAPVNGGLDLDSAPHAISDGDGRNRHNVVPCDDESVRCMSIPTAHTIDIAQINSVCVNGGGEVSCLAKTTGGDVFSVTRGGIDFYYPKEVGWFSQKDLYRAGKPIQFEQHGDYYFITTEGSEPLMIKKDGYAEYADAGPQVVGIRYDTATRKVILVISDKTAVVTGTVRFQPNSKGMALGAVVVEGTNAKTWVDEDVPSFAFVYIPVDEPLSIKTVDEESGCGVIGNIQVPRMGKQLVDKPFPIYENLTTIRPVPMAAPTVRMVGDASVTYNNFAESTYSYGYTWVYDDGYETPMSPLSRIDLTALKEAASGRSGSNVVEIYTAPLYSVKKVKIYAKRDKVSNSFVLVAERDYKNEIKVRWDGLSIQGVKSNEEWVRSCESIPLSAKTMGYLPDDRIVYGHIVEGYDTPKMKMWGEAVVESLDDGWAAGHYPINKILSVGFDDDSWYWPDTALDSLGPWSSRKGTVNITIIVPGYGVLYATVEFPAGTDQHDLFPMIADALAAKYPDGWTFLMDTTYNVFRISRTKGHLDRVKLGISGKYFFAHGVYERTLKSGGTYDVGVVWKDRAGRSSGVCTDEYCTFSVPDRAGRAYKSSLRMYMENVGHPAWADFASVVMRRSPNVYSQYMLPCKDTAGYWGATNAFIQLVDGVYRIHINGILPSGGGGHMYYQFREGDYVRPVAWYGTLETLPCRSEFPDKTAFRITGRNNDGSFSIHDTTGSADKLFDYWSGAVDNEVADYIKLEVVNRGQESTYAEETWTEVGDTFVVVDGSLRGVSSSASSETHPDGTTTEGLYVGYDIDCGDYFLRGIQDAGASWDDGYRESMFTIESRYATEQIGAELFDTGRVRSVQDDGQVERPVLRYGGVMVSGSDVDNRRVFNADAVVELGEEYGDLSAIKVRGNTVRVYCERKTGTSYVNADEMSYQDGTKNLVYSSNVLSKVRWSDSIFGCTDPRSVVGAGAVVYFYDSVNKCFCKDTVGGVFNISGHSGETNGKVSSYFKQFPLLKAVGYNPENRIVYLYDSEDNRFMMYSEDRGRWIGTADARGVYFAHGGGKMVSWDSSTWYDHAVTEDSLLYTNGVMDVVVAPERFQAKNYGALVLHAPRVMDGTVNCYTKTWDDQRKTLLPKGIYKEWDGMFYADIPQGSEGVSVRTSDLYGGVDMVGKVGVLTLTGEVDVSAVEVRYSVINR